MEDVVYWIWLSLSCTPDSATFPRLLEKFSDAKEIYDAGIKEISEAVGYRTSDRRALGEKNLDRALGIYEFCKKNGVGLLPYSDSRYPDALRNIPTPPVLLYYRGELPDFNLGVYIAAVGTRRLSDYGRRSAFTVSYDLALSGATIVSGMAVGIDAVAHAGALSAGAKTVAVLGSGINVCYPPEHLNLAREIVKSGCIITEYPPDAQPTKYSFPRRNRIISGLSAATLVFEGTERSGSIITARHAKSQGRPVYALPGNVGNKTSEASNLLIKNGAKLFRRAEDIIDDLQSSHPGRLNPFLLNEKCPVDILRALRTYRVSALTQSDDVFLPPKSRKIWNKRGKIKAVEYSAEIPADSAQEFREPPADFNKRALEIYKRIPLTEDCTIESLIDSEYPLREVMKALLKLEMGSFIVLLPGERVKRKRF